jgi:hypothetical protein
MDFLFLSIKYMNGFKIYLCKFENKLDIRHYVKFIITCIFVEAKCSKLIRSNYTNNYYLNPLILNLNINYKHLINVV